MAEKKIPLPMEMFSVGALIGLLLCLFVSQSSDKDEKVARTTIPRVTEKSSGVRKNSEDQDDKEMKDALLES